MSGTYVYAIMRGDRDPGLGKRGLLDGTTPVSGVSAGNLTAIVSPYQGSAPENLSRADLLQSLVIHQQVLEAAMAEGPLLPVKFGTVLRSEEEVRDVLTHYHARLQAALADVGEAVEIDLSATWDVDAVLVGLAQNPQLAAGSQSLEDRVRVGSLVAEMLEQRRNGYRQRVVSELVPLARDTQPIPLPSEDLVFNLAFLVEREDLTRFEAAVDGLGEELGDVLAFRYVGPLPPHSFATIELAYPDPAAIESARRVLGTGDELTPAELRRAYRDLAAQQHPDHNRDDPAAPERFSTLAAAHETLDLYMQGRREAEERPDNDYRYDLSTEAVAGTVLLAIIRADVEPRPRRTVSHEPEPAH
jgi:hypothetical protein